MIAEGSFLSQHVSWNRTFKYEFRFGRDVKRNAFALYHRHRASAKIACKRKFIHAVWKRSDRGENHPGVSSEDDRSFKISSEFFRFVVVRGSSLVRVPMHPGGLAVKYLQPVNPQVSRAGSGIPCEHQAEGYELSPIARPAFYHRKPREIRFGFNLLNIAAPHFFRSHGKQTGGLGKHGEKPPYRGRINLAEYLDKFLADV